MRTLHVYKDETTGKYVEEWIDTPKPTEPMLVMPPCPQLPGIIIKVRAEQDGVATCPRPEDL
jgi:hypothetical protein